MAVVEVGAALLQEHRADREHEYADGDVDEEDPGPAECAGQRATEQDAGCATASGGCAPDSECDVAVASLPERRGQDRECRRREQRGAEPLQAAEGDQRRRRPGEAVEQREDREHGHADHEDAPAAEQVGHPAAEQEDAAEHDRVGSDHPLEAAFGEVQVVLDRR